MAKTKRSFSAEERSFLKAIHAQPRSDTLRLIYADWLEEHGQPELAEFVRLQVENCFELHAPRPSARTLEKFRQEKVPEDKTERMRRSAALNLSSWSRPCPESIRVVSFFRGLPIAAVPWWAGRHRMYGNFLGAASPRLRFNFYLTDDAQQIAYDLNHPIFQRVHCLAVGSIGRVRVDPLKEDRVTAISGWLGVGNVQHIELWGMPDERMQSVRTLFPRHVAIMCYPPTH